MPTLTNSSTFTVGAAVPAVDSTVLQVLSAPGASSGKGRLTHPTLGVFDYLHKPDNWSNIDGDIIAAPIWASTRTLEGSANTLWRADLRDVTVSEQWNSASGTIKMKIAMLRTLIAFFTNPPDPATAWVIWTPNYSSSFSYRVLMLNLTVGGENILLDEQVDRGWVTGDINLTMKIVAKV